MEVRNPNGTCATKWAYGRIRSGAGWARISAAPGRPVGVGMLVVGLPFVLLFLPTLFLRHADGGLESFAEMTLRQGPKTAGLVVLGLVWVVLGLLALTETRHIEVREGTLRVYHRPLPLSGWRLPTVALVELAIEWRPPTANAVGRYRVIARTARGESLDVIVGVPSKAEAQLVQLTLGRALGPGVALR